MIPKKNPNKAKRYPEDEKRKLVALIHSGQMTPGQLTKKKKLGNATVAGWLKRYPAPQKGTGEVEPAAGTAIVPVHKDNHYSRYSDEDRDRVLAMIDKGQSVVAASKLVGVSDKTIYGWLVRRRKKAARSVQPAEPTTIEASPGVTAVIGASQRALIMLRQARTSKLDAIRSNQVSGNPFPDEFCLSQLAHNELARVLGMK